MIRLALLPILLIFISIDSFAQSIEDEIDAQRYFDTTFYQPVNHYDNAKNVILQEFIIKRNGKKLNWRVHSEYDKKGNEIKITYTDTLNEGVSGVVCQAPIIKKAYDDKRNVTEVAYYDKNGKPDIHDCAHFHKKKMVYNSQGNVIKEQYFDVKQDMYTNIAFKHDAKGQIIEVNYLDKKDQLDKEDYSIVRVKYDEQGRKIEQRHFDWQNKPINKEGEISYITFEYKEDGFMLVTYYDGSDKVLRKQKEKHTGAASMTVPTDE